MALFLNLYNIQSLRRNIIMAKNTKTPADTLSNSPGAKTKKVYHQHGNS